jgi:hypothetical protein
MILSVKDFVQQFSGDLNLWVCVVDAEDEIAALGPFYPCVVLSHVSHSAVNFGG